MKILWMLRTACVGVTMLTATQAVAAGAAGSYPSQPLRVIVPFSAGGGNDIVARLLAQHLNPVLNTTVVVENRPGAGGNIGLRGAAMAPADGYTVGYVSNGVVMNPYLYRDVGFDIASDFEPVAGLVTTPIWVLTHPNLKVESMAQLLAKAKADPGGLTYATPGVGTPHHLGAELLQAMAGVSMVHVPYKGASGAATDVVGGQVDVLISTPASVQGFVKSGQLRALASMAPQRSAEMPDLPVVAETLPGFGAGIWHGLVVPRGTDPAVIQTLSAAVERVLADPGLQQSLLAAGFSAAYESPQDLRDRIARELVMWRDVTSQAGIKPE